MEFVKRARTISSKLRSVFGPLLDGEPTISFEQDGSIMIYINNCKVSLNREAVDYIYSRELK